MRRIEYTTTAKGSVHMKPKASERLEKLTQRIKGINWKEIFTGRTAAALGSLALVCAVIAAVAVLGSDAKSAGSDESTKLLGQSVLVGLEVSDADAQEYDYFETAAINRRQVREEALAVLSQIAENPDVLPDTKDEALADIARIAEEMSTEADIESLIAAKGIADCIAVYSEEQCTVIVRTDGLMESETAQILEIVVAQTSLSPENVKIIEC